jgi:hypothetical protein
MESGNPPEKFRGTETVRSVGGLWVFCEAAKCLMEEQHLLL